MKKWGWLLVIVFCGSLYVGNAEASVLNWPVISQLTNVGRCLVADSGKITNSLVTHATAFTVETLQIVSECLLYATHQVTPGLVADHS